MLAAGAFLEPGKWDDPFLRLDAAEVFLLGMQVGRNVVAQKREEAGDGKGLIAAHQDFKINGMPIVEI